MNGQLTTNSSKESRELFIRDMQDAECTCAIARLQVPSPVEEQARQYLAKNCPYVFCFKDISFEFEGGVLILRGRVPTFYLKQMLQTWLRKLDGIKQIDNQVDVVCATGLSSELRVRSLEST